MLRIGDFSKIARVSIRMLRHYDQIGLLKPADVDSVSGYRSYSLDQLPRLNRIIFLKGLGFSLNEINELIDSNISVNEMKVMLKKRQKELENEITIAQLNLNTVLDRLKTIENEGAIPKYDVTVKSTDGYTIASIRQIVPNLKDMGIYCYDMYSRLYKELDRLDVGYTRSEITLYHNEEYSETDLDMEAGVVIRSAGSSVRIDGIALKIRDIPSENTVASLIYKGSFEGLENAVIELLKWIAMNNWEIRGELRELHLSGPAHVDGEVRETSIIELQVPVHKLF